MFSDHDETSPSIAAVLAPSVACSMLAVQQQKRLCHQFVNYCYLIGFLVFRLIGTLDNYSSDDEPVQHVLVVLGLVSEY